MQEVKLLPGPGGPSYYYYYHYYYYIYIYIFFFLGGGEGGIKMRVGVQGLGLGYENSKRVLQGFCNQIARNRCYLWSLDPKVGTIRILGVLG